MPRVIYSVWGESVYLEGGEPYASAPRVFFGTMSRSTQIVYDALLKVLGKSTETDIRDKDIRGKTGLNLRTIQRALYALHYLLKAITRERAEGRRTIKLGYRLAASREEEEVEVDREAAAKPVPPAKPVDLSYGKWAVEFSEKKGWRLLEDAGKLIREPIPGREQDEIPASHKQGVASGENLLNVLAYLRSTHKKE